MSFHINAEDIELEDGHILKANLPNEEGEMIEATFDLNEVLGNNEGTFAWEGVNFAESAEDIEFELEGDDGNPILRAKLSNSEGEQQDADVNLAERISNSNGEFRFE